MACVFAVHPVDVLRPVLPDGGSQGVFRIRRDEGSPKVRDFGHLRRVLGLHRVSRIGQVPRGIVNGGPHRRMAGHPGGLTGHGDADGAGRLRAFQGRGRPPGIQRASPRHRSQRQPQVAYLPRHRALDAHQLEGQRPLRLRAGSVGGDASQRGPQSRYAAGVARVPQRSPQVAPLRNGSDAQRHRGRPASGGTAGGHALVPGIVGHAPQGVVGEPAQAELRGVGASDHDRPGARQIRHHGRVLVGHVLPIGRDAVGVGQPGLVHVVLDGDGHATQRTEGAGGGVGGCIGCGVRLPCPFQGRLRQVHDHGVHRGVGLPHAGQGGFHGLHAGDTPFANGGCGLGGAPAPDFLGHRVSFYTFICLFR